MSTLFIETVRATPIKTRENGTEGMADYISTKNSCFLTHFVHNVFLFFSTNAGYGP